jgi:ribulose-5-phosphate 4-epimerase/fuculose-1-phosphate aldolase
MSATTAVKADLAREIARATRALAVAGLFDMHGHISVRDSDLAYINSRRASRISVRREEIAVVRIADGKVLAGEPPSETPLHLAVYRAREDAGSVAHFHPLYATAFAVAGRPLVTAFNAGAIFGEQVPVFDDPDLIQQDDQGRRMAEALGGRRAVLLRGHGVAVCAEDIPSCVTASLYLE